jgi:hypothetical protein
MYVYIEMLRILIFFVWFDVMYSGDYNGSDAALSVYQQVWYALKSLRDPGGNRTPVGIEWPFCFEMFISKHKDLIYSNSWIISIWTSN